MVWIGMHMDETNIFAQRVLVFNIHTYKTSITSG